MPSEASPDPQEPQAWSLIPPSPLRALVPCAVLVVVAAGVLLATDTLGWPRGVTVAAVVVLLVAAAVAVTVLVSVARMQATLVLDAEALTIGRARRRVRLPWAEIDQVDLQGARLQVRTKAGKTVSVLNPSGSDDPAFGDLVEALQRRLDADRGYRNA